MAEVSPYAEWRPFSGKSTTPLVFDIICVHTEVGRNEVSISIGAQPGHSYAHQYLAGSGYLAQCQDLRYRAAANLNGNWHVISIETEDVGGVFPVPWANPPWTQQQLDKLIPNIAWMCLRFNIPPVLIPNTRPGNRGLAYHRQGCQGNFVPYDGIVAGGELWSKAFGKTCPANRVAQFISIVIPGVQDLVWGVQPPPPEEEEEVEMDSYVMYNENGSFWLVEERAIHQISDDMYSRYINQLGLKAIAPTAADANALINHKHALMAADGVAV